MLLQAKEVPDAHLKDDVYAEYIKALRRSPDYYDFAEGLRQRREALEVERKISTLRAPLGMSKEAGSMRHQASIPQEAWSAHEKLWPGLTNKDRAAQIRKHLPECFF